MDVGELRARISERAQDLLPMALLEAGVDYHTRRKGDWRFCPCQFCATKREATVVIGSHVPRTRGFYVEDRREVWRENKRKEYRNAMKAIKEEVYVQGT